MLKMFLPSELRSVDRTVEQIFCLFSSNDKI